MIFYKYINHLLILNLRCFIQIPSFLNLIKVFIKVLAKGIMKEILKMEQRN